MSGAPGAAPRRTVALVTTSFPLTRGSMSGVFVRRLADALAVDWRLRVVVPAGEQAPSFDHPYPVDAVRYAPRRWRRLAHRPGGLPAALARRDPALLLLPALLVALGAGCRRAARGADLVHANWSLAGAVAAFAAGRRPLVTTLRGSDVRRAERSPLDRRLLAFCARRSAALVTVSPALAERAARLLPHPPRHLLAIANGIDDACFAAAGRRREPAAGEPLRLLGVGNLVAHKDVETALRALAALPAGAGWRLRWLGEGPDGARLRALAAELGIAGAVEWGGVEPEAVAGHLAAADLFVFTSRGEGRPNALLEAMAAGLPAVAPRVPGVADLVGDGEEALLYEAGDADGLGRRLARLLADPGLRRRLAAAARGRVEREGWTWAEAARRYGDLYRRLLGEAGSAAG